MKFGIGYMFMVSLIMLEIWIVYVFIDFMVFIGVMVYVGYYVIIFVKESFLIDWLNLYYFLFDNVK